MSGGPRDRRVIPGKAERGWPMCFQERSPLATQGSVRAVSLISVNSLFAANANVKTDARREGPCG